MVKRDKFDSAKHVLDYYKSEYRNRFGIAPIFNRIKIQYMLVDIMTDINVNELKELIKFFVSTDKYADILNFCYDYDQVINDKSSLQNDAENRRNLMKQTKQSVEQFRGRYNAE